jgi:hypothetical protein
MNRQEVERSAYEVLAADLGCDVELFKGSGVAVIPAKLSDAGRWFKPARELMIASLGSCVIVACAKRQLDWAQHNLAQLTREDIFSPPGLSMIYAHVREADPRLTLSVPFIRYICASETLGEEPPAPPDVEIRVHEPPDFGGLGELQDMSNVLAGGKHAHRNRYGIAAYRSGKLLAASGAAEVAPGMWEVGNETYSPQRRGGLAHVLLHRTTSYVLSQGVAPFGSAAIANIVTQRMIQRFGWRPIWMDVTADWMLPP